MDTTVISMIPDEALAIFGVPVGWLLATTPLVIGWINTVKALLSNWMQSGWYPAIAGAVCLVYSYMTLAPNVVAIIAGGVALWLTQWVTWAAAKRAAAGAGARQE